MISGSTCLGIKGGGSVVNVWSKVCTALIILQQFGRDGLLELPGLVPLKFSLYGVAMDVQGVVN